VIYGAGGNKFNTATRPINHRLAYLGSTLFYKCLISVIDGAGQVCGYGWVLHIPSEKYCKIIIIQLFKSGTHTFFDFLETFFSCVGSGYVLAVFLLNWL
jgi:hypothetical protein